MKAPRCSLNLTFHDDADPVFHVCSLHQQRESWHSSTRSHLCIATSSSCCSIRVDTLIASPCVVSFWYSNDHSFSGGMYFPFFWLKKCISNLPSIKPLHLNLQPFTEHCKHLLAASCNMYLKGKTCQSHLFSFALACTAFAPSFHFPLILLLTHAAKQSEWAPVTLWINHSKRFLNNAVSGPDARCVYVHALVCVKIAHLLPLLLKVPCVYNFAQRKMPIKKVQMAQARYDPAGHLFHPCERSDGQAGCDYPNTQLHSWKTIRSLIHRAVY